MLVSAADFYPLAGREGPVPRLTSLKLVRLGWRRVAFTVTTLVQCPGVGTCNRESDSKNIFVFIVY